MGGRVVNIGIAIDVVGSVGIFQSYVMSSSFQGHGYNVCEHCVGMGNWVLCITDVAHLSMPHFVPESFIST